MLYRTYACSITSFIAIKKNATSFFSLPAVIKIRDMYLLRVPKTLLCAGVLEMVGVW